MSAGFLHIKNVHFIIISGLVFKCSMQLDLVVFYFLVHHQQYRQVPQYFISNVLMNDAVFVLVGHGGEMLFSWVCAKLQKTINKLHHCLFENPIHFPLSSFTANDNTSNHTVHILISKLKYFSSTVLTWRIDTFISRQTCADPNPTREMGSWNFWK